MAPRLVMSSKLSVRIIHYTKLTNRRSNCELLCSIFRNQEPRIITEDDICVNTSFAHFLKASSRSAEFQQFQAKYISRGVIINANPVFGRSFAADPNSVKVLNMPGLLTDAFQFINLSPPSESTVQHALQHNRALAEIVSCGSEWGLILEDDATIASPDRLLRLIRMLEQDSQLLDKPTYLDLSNGCNLKPDDWDHEVTFSQEKCYEMIPARTRTAVAYIVNSRFAANALSEIRNIYMAIDWHYAYCLSKFNSLCLWSDHAFFNEGSALGNYESNATDRSSRNK